LPNSVNETKLTEMCEASCFISNNVGSYLNGRSPSKVNNLPLDPRFCGRCCCVAVAVAAFALGPFVVNYELAIIAFCRFYL